MPLLALLLPFDQRVDLLDRFGFVDVFHVHGALEEGVHVELAALGAVAQELQDPLQPAHQRGEEPVVVDVDLVHELVEVLLVAAAEVDEALDRLVGVGGDVLPLRGVEDSKGVIGEGGEVRDGVVDVGGFVDPHEGFVEDGEEVAEEVERDRFLDDGEHLRLVPLPGVHLEELFELGEEHGASAHFLVDVINGVVPSDVCVEGLADLFRGEFGGDLVGAEDDDDKIDVFGGGFAAEVVLELLGGIDEGEELFAESCIVDLGHERVDILLETSDAVVECHTEYTLGQRLGPKRLGQEEVKNTRHYHCRVCKADDLLQSDIRHH